MNASEKTVCVAGASGLVGSNIVVACLERGYRVNGTLRDKTEADKVPYLEALPGAAERLTLFEADMSEADAFDPALRGVDCVFVACLTPTYVGPSGTPAREMDKAQGYAEIIMPTVNGCLNILRSAARQGVKNAVICSSTSSTNPIPPVPVKNEIDHWSDVEEQCKAKKYTSAAKPVMEKAAMAFADENGMRLSILMPTLMFGPVVLPRHLDETYQSMLKKLINGEPPRHEKVPNDSMSMIHIEDLAALFLAAYENPEASGRYFGVVDSWHWKDIYAELAKLLPNAKMPAPLTEDPAPATRFDFTRRDSLGVPIRDVPTLLRETVEWIKTGPFS